MAWYRHNWYYMGMVLFIALSCVIGFWGNHFSTIQVILIFSFMAMLIHQCEEYAYPGGFPSIANIISFGEKDVPERYPLNANQCLISNVFLTYPFYILPVFFPNAIWFGLAQMLLGMTIQLLAHGIMVNIRLKSFYNPGLAAVVFLHVPIGIYYIWYVTTNHLASTGDFIIGPLATIAASLLLFGLPIRLLRSRTSHYPFSAEEMDGFARQKVAKIRNA
jgi:hypothetical protein